MPPTIANPEPIAGASRTTQWSIQRAGGSFKFQLDLTANDPAEKTVLDCYDNGILYEGDVAGLMINVLRSGDIVVDVGATQTGGVLAYLVGCHVVVIQPVRNKASTAPRAQLRARSKASAYGLAAGSTCCPSCDGIRLSARSD